MRKRNGVRAVFDHYNFYANYAIFTPAPFKFSIKSNLNGAQKRTRTSKGLLPLGPEPSASTSSAIWAFCGAGDRS